MSYVYNILHNPKKIHSKDDLSTSIIIDVDDHFIRIFDHINKTDIIIYADNPIIVKQYRYTKKYLFKIYDLLSDLFEKKLIIIRGKSRLMHALAPLLSYPNYKYNYLDIVINYKKKLAEYLDDNLPPVLAMMVLFYL